MSESSGHHVVPVPVYLAIFLSLMVLTAVTVWVAFIDLGFLNTAVALAIAVFKASLVVLYFMHLRYVDRLNWAVWAVGILFLLILFSFTISDYMNRWPLSRGQVPAVPEPVAATHTNR